MDEKSGKTGRSSLLSGKSRDTTDTHICKINGYMEYEEHLNDIDESKSLYIFFTSTVSPTSGYSWSPECLEVREILEKYIAEQEDTIFWIVQVGSQEEWESPINPFRSDRELHLRVIPTVLKYKTLQRLEGKFCLNPELLDVLFEGDWEF